MDSRFLRNYCTPPWPDRKRFKEVEKSVASLLGWDSLCGVKPLQILEIFIPIFKDSDFCCSYIAKKEWTYGMKSPCLYDFENHRILIREDIMIGAYKETMKDVFIILTIIHNYLSYIEKEGK